MAFSINKVTLVGNITRDPELRYTPSGAAVATFGVATNRSIKKGDNWEDEPTFHNVVVWNKLAEYAANFVKKGVKIYVDGRIQNRSYENKEGQKVNVSEVIAESIIPFSKPKEEIKDDLEEPKATEEPKTEEPTESRESENPEDDGIPF